MDDIAEALRTLPRPGGGRLTGHELQVLGDLGIDPDATSRTPLATGVLRRRQLEQASLTTEQAATLLAWLTDPQDHDGRSRAEAASLGVLA